MNRFRLSKVVAVALKYVPIASPFAVLRIASGSVPLAITTFVPERRAKSAACSLVIIPPVPSSSFELLADFHNSSGISLLVISFNNLALGLVRGSDVNTPG